MGLGSRNRHKLQMRKSKSSVQCVNASTECCVEDVSLKSGRTKNHGNVLHHSSDDEDEDEYEERYPIFRERAGPPRCRYVDDGAFYLTALPGARIAKNTEAMQNV